jgi:MFS transporter, SP family, sugar:H+ symporter
MPTTSAIDSNSPAAPQTSLQGIAIGKIALVAASAAMGGFLFGFDTAVINGAVDAIKAWSGAASWLLGFAVAGALLGSAIGAWFAGPLADRYGRIAAMKIAAAIFFVSSIGTGLAWSIEALSIFRFFGGTAIGAASVIAPAYIAEVSPASYRGRLGSLQQLAIVTGIFVALRVTMRSPPRQAERKSPFGWECRPGAGCSLPQPFLPPSMPASPA